VQVWGYLLEKKKMFSVAALRQYISEGSNQHLAATIFS